MPKAEKGTKADKPAKAEKQVKAEKADPSDKEEKLPQPSLSDEEKRLLSLRRSINSSRPKFVRTASHRYWRIGRWESWRRPKGLQSKQRRHYQYRPVVVSIGYGNPAKVRGRTPLGLIPVIIHAEKELKELEPTKHMVIIARGVGTRRRLILEEVIKKDGFRLANPLTRGGREEE